MCILRVYKLVFEALTIFTGYEMVSFLFQVLLEIVVNNKVPFSLTNRAQCL